MPSNNLVHYNVKNGKSDRARIGTWEQVWQFLHGLSEKWSYIDI